MGVLVLSSRLHFYNLLKLLFVCTSTISQNMESSGSEDSPATTEASFKLYLEAQSLYRVARNVKVGLFLKKVKKDKKAKTDKKEHMTTSRVLRTTSIPIYQKNSQNRLPE